MSGGCSQPSCRAAGLWAGLTFAAAPLVYAATNAPGPMEDIPPLRPPKPELFPGTWEQHGLWVVLGTVLILLLVAALWRYLSRPGPVQVQVPANLARRALRSLLDRAEDARLWAEVSAILRRYLTTTLQLPDREYTHAELSRVLLDHEHLPGDLARGFAHLLDDMDQGRFNPDASPGEPGCVQEVLNLIEQTERHLHPTPTVEGTAASAA